MSSQTATILVSDLVGSTELRARIGDEHAERLRRLHDRLSRTAIETHGGIVVKGLGDGVLASFSEASAAVAAAVAIQQAADAHTKRHPDLALVLRIGLSAGDVTVDANDYFGTPVVEAARLCAAADGGQILAAEVIRLLVKGRARHPFAAVGELELKGLPETVATLEVGWARPTETTPAPFPQLLSMDAGLGFTGRRAEQERLQAAWRNAAAGQRASVLIAGEPGVGKTRLAAEAARAVHRAGATVLYGRCQETLGVPYEPFLEALTFFSEHTPPAELRSRLGRYPGELVRLLPELGDLVPGLDPPLRSDPETEQYRLFQAVTSWLVAAGETSGLFMVVDDLHWAAPPTLRLLAHVLRVTGTARLLVAVTFRDTEMSSGQPLAAFLADLRRIPGTERIALEGLTAEELTELLGAETAPRLVATLHDETKGNPFFVGEILRDRTESGLDLDSLPVPEGVRDVILSRVGRLAPTTGEVLAVAAVLGRDVEIGPLAAVAGVDHGAVVDALDEALAARLLEEARAGAYRFVHALVRSALDGVFSATRKAPLHLKAADVFADDPSRVAHHLIASGPIADPTRTAKACLAAGDRALSLFADAEAGDWYGQGLHVLTDEEDLNLRVDLLTGLGEAQRRTGQPESRQTLIDAAHLAARQGDVVRVVRAVLANNRGVASVVGFVDYERLELLGVGLELVGPAASPERAELLSVQALELVFAGDHEAVLRAADEAGAIADSLDDVTVRARVGMRRLWASLVPDRITALADEGADVVAFADRSRDPQLRAWSRALWGHSLLLTGRLLEAGGRAAEAMAIADETGQPGQRCLAYIYGSVAADAVGDNERAARLTQTALELGQKSGWPDATSWCIGQMALPWIFEGQAETAVVMAAQGIADYPSLVLWQAFWALGLALTGRTEELADVLGRWPTVSATVPVDLMWLATHAIFAAAQGFGVENRQAAGVTYERLLPYRAFHAAYGVVGYLGPIEMALAVLARVTGDLDAALRHHEAAAATIEAGGAARARAFNGYQWTRTLVARDTPGDRQRAMKLAEETLAYCTTKSYTTFVTKTEELLTTIR